MTYKLEQLEDAVDLALFDLVLTDEKRQLLVERCLQSPATTMAEAQTRPSWPWKKVAAIASAAAAVLLLVVGLRVFGPVSAPKSAMEEATDSAIDREAGGVLRSEMVEENAALPEAFPEAPSTTALPMQDAPAQASTMLAPAPTAAKQALPEIAAMKEEATADAAPQAAPDRQRFFNYTDANANGFYPPIPSFLPGDLHLLVIETKPDDQSSASHYGNDVDTSYLQIDTTPQAPEGWFSGAAEALKMNGTTVYITSEALQNADSTEGERAVAAWQGKSACYRLTLFRPSGQARDELIEIAKGITDKG